MRNIILSIMFLCLSGIAWADPVHIDAEGVRATREMAVTKALVSAIEQATGVAIDVAQLSATKTESIATQTSYETKMDAGIQEEISRKAGGTIRSYRITSITPAAEGGFVAEVGI